MKYFESRELTFQLLFERSFSNATIEELVELAMMARDIVPDDYVLRILRGVEEKQEELDAIITRFSRARTLARLSKVVLAVLRLSLYEITYFDEVDAPVSINEAVELTKTYGGKEESGFVNGVLGSYVRSLEGAGEQ